MGLKQSDAGRCESSNKSKMAPGNSELLDYFLVPAGKLLLTKGGKKRAYLTGPLAVPTGTPRRRPAYPSLHASNSGTASHDLLTVFTARAASGILVPHAEVLALIDAGLRKPASASQQRMSRTSTREQSGLKPATFVCRLPELRPRVRRQVRLRFCPRRPERTRRCRDLADPERSGTRPGPSGSGLLGKS